MSERIKYYAIWDNIAGAYVKATATGYRACDMMKGHERVLFTDFSDACAAAREFGGDWTIRSGWMTV